MTYSESVSVALVIQLEKGMRRFMLSSVACPALQKFSILLDELNTYVGRSDGNLSRLLSLPSENRGLELEEMEWYLCSSPCGPDAPRP
jgi:hypothetical protein